MHLKIDFKKYIVIFVADKIKTMKKAIISIWRFYVDGFKNMTWGRPLWGLIFLKIIILFLVLRLFFFEPILAGKTEAEKIEHVSGKLTKPNTNN